MPQEPPSQESPSQDQVRPSTLRSGPLDAAETLRKAMRRARFDDAERIGVQANLRMAQIVRLELLQDAMAPLLAQIPKGVDLFDVGLMPGGTPRLFIDMIGFVEMGRDARAYRLLQDTRHGRVTLAESSDLGVTIDAITDYIARRLIERDKALASDETSGGARPNTRRKGVLAVSEPTTAPARDQRTWWRWAGVVFAFVIDLLGAIAFFTLLAGAGWIAWNRFNGPV
jgi:hypothetical protein